MRTATLGVRNPVGSGEVRYLEALNELAGRVDALDARRKAALFWLLGSGLLQRLQPPEVWGRWIEEAQSLGHRYVVSGEVPDGAADLWRQAQTPADDDSSQLLNSTVICLSTPLGLAAGRCETVGSWLEHAFFPLVQHESLKLLDDVAFPDEDEDLELVFGQPTVQQAFTFCRSALGRLEANDGAPDAGLLEVLLADAAYVAPPEDEL